MSEQPEKLANGKRADGVSESISKQWPSTFDACAQTGLNKKQLCQLEARGELRSGRDPHNVTRWDPDLLALYVEKHGDDAGDAAPVSEAGLNGQALVLLRQAQGHTEAAFKLVLDPMQQLLKAREEDVEALRARVKELEAKLDEAFVLREKMLSEQHIRDLVAADAERANQRKDKALKLAEEHAPKLLAAFNPQAQTVLAVMRSLTEEQRALMLETDFLNAEQKMQVRALLASSPPAPDVAASPVVESPP